MKQILIVLVVFSGLVLFSCEIKKKTVQPYEDVEVGYGVEKSTELTTSVSTVKPNEEYPTVLTLADMLRRVPGVQVMGQHPNVTVGIRGVNSIHSNSQPLYVVNGAVLGNDYEFVAESIDVNDIESVTVLKDSGASIYGSRASNGVVLITLRKD